MGLHKTVVLLKHFNGVEDGLVVEVLTPVEQNLLCQRCRCLTPKLHRDNELHGFCESCFEKIVDDDRIFTCFVDKKTYALDMIFPEDIEDNLKTLQVYCSKHCDERQMPFPKFLGHYANCKGETAHSPSAITAMTNYKCPLCGEIFPAAFLVQHCRDQCPERVMTCLYCQTDYRAVHEKEHMQECNMREVFCHVCMGIFPVVHLKENHTQLELNEKLKAIEDKISEFEREKQNLENDHKEEVKRLHLEMADYQKTVANINGQINRLQEDLIKSEERKQTIEDHYSDEISKLREEKEKYERTTAEQSEKITALQSSLKEIEDKKQDLEIAFEREIGTQKLEKEKYQEIIEELNKQITLSLKSLEHSEEDKRNVEGKLKEEIRKLEQEKAEKEAIEPIDALLVPITDSGLKTDTRLEIVRILGDAYKMQKRPNYA